jgi:hypothetical protein
VARPGVGTQAAVTWTTLLQEGFVTANGWEVLRSGSAADVLPP